MTPAASPGFTELEAPTSTDGPEWLAKSRRDAFTWIDEHGYPTKKDEDWKYLKLNKVLSIPFEVADTSADRGVDASFIADHTVDLGGDLLVFIDGRFNPALSHLVEPAPGVHVDSIATVLAEHPDKLEALWTMAREGENHAFRALNTGLAVDGAFIGLDADAKVLAPIQLVFVSTGTEAPEFVSPRSVVLAGPKSSATIVQTYLSTDGDTSCTNGVTEVVLDEGAQIDHYKVQSVAETAFHFTVLDVVQNDDSTFNSHTFALGAAIARDEIHVRLEGDRASVSLDGLFVPRGDQQHDHPIRIDHFASHGTSRQMYKGVLDENGHGVFNGRVIVHPGSLATDADQSNRNLLLSDRADVDTRPRLEIFADDVKATHGAAVGRLDEDAMFYLRSRGLPEAEARAVLTYAFAEEMVDRIRLDPLRERVEDLVAAHLSQLGIEVARE